MAQRGCWGLLGPQSCPSREAPRACWPSQGWVRWSATCWGLLGASYFRLTSTSLPPRSLCLCSSAAPSPSCAPRLSLFGGDYAVLTLEYELGESISQILELGRARAQAGSQERLEHLCLGRSRCLTRRPPENDWSQSHRQTPLQPRLGPPLASRGHCYEAGRPPPHQCSLSQGPGGGRCFGCDLMDRGTATQGRTLRLSV